MTNLETQTLEAVTKDRDEWKLTYEETHEELNRLLTKKQLRIEKLEAAIKAAEKDIQP